MRPRSTGRRIRTPTRTWIAPPILVVDDSDDVRSYLRRHLSDSFRVLEAADGAQGLHTAREELPDVVISDVMMPEMSGLELCAALRSDAATAYDAVHPGDRPRVDRGEASGARRRR